jgi:hypothetical protein
LNDQEKEVISENEPRSNFGWLRFGGWARHEAKIWKHEWLDTYDSDEDEDTGDEETSCPLQAVKDETKRIPMKITTVHPNTGK